MDSVGASDVVDGDIGQAHGPDLACGHEPGHRRDRFLDRGVLAAVVQVVQVDDVDAEAPQARLARRHDGGGIGADGEVVRTARVAPDHSELGAQRHLVTACGDGATDQLLVAVHLGRVEERDPRIERSVHDRDRVTVGVRSPCCSRSRISPSPWRGGCTLVHSGKSVTKRPYDLPTASLASTTHPGRRRRYHPGR